jgi:hypothetical protein
MPLTNYSEYITWDNFHPSTRFVLIFYRAKLAFYLSSLMRQLGLARELAREPNKPNHNTSLSSRWCRFISYNLVF